MAKNRRKNASTSSTSSNKKSPTSASNASSSSGTTIVTMGTSSGSSAMSGKGVDVTLKLSQLQNLCKRDPEGYRQDYDAQVRRLESEYQILSLSPTLSTGSAASLQRLVELIQFCAAVGSSVAYKDTEATRISNLLIAILLGNKPTAPKQQQKEQKESISSLLSLSSGALQLHKDIRKACVSALILMRNKGAMDPLPLVELFFRLMSILPDKSLRDMLFAYMVQDVRNINVKGKRQDRVNRALQTFLHRIVSSTSSSKNNNNNNTENDVAQIAMKRATDMVCELYRRNIWTDERTVAILATAAAASNALQVQCRAIRFFLNIEETMANDQQEGQEQQMESANQINLHLHSKKTKSNARHVAKQVKQRRKVQLKIQQQQQQADGWLYMDVGGTTMDAAKKLYPAIEMLRDPQGLAETVFHSLKSSHSSLKYDVKLLMLNFVTRLVGNHELLLLPLYPYLQRYLGGGHQTQVTAILAYTVQACHVQVPPDEVFGLLKTIAHNFITERCSEEEMAVGINAARAICRRVPAVLVVSQDDDDDVTVSSVHLDIEAFCRDLAGFAKHRDRSVSMAGKGWTNFIRETNPGLLQGKHRGLQGTALYRAGQRPLRYGEERVAAGVDGADLLVEYESKKAAAAVEQQEDWETDDDDDDEEEEEEVPMNDEIEESNENEEEEEEEDEEDSDEEAPTLVVYDEKEAANANHEGVVDLSKMSREERDRLKQEVSSSRIFSAADFVRMRKLVERENRARRDPREAARRKRAIARGEEFDGLSDDDSDDDDDDESDDDEVRIAGAVSPTDIMAQATRKRMSKVERLESILTGRQKFEAKQHGGGSTNTEKKRRKNFVMSKYSYSARSKHKGKSGLKRKKSEERIQDGRKRRRKV